MIKFILLASLLLLASAVESSRRVGSWNIRNFSSKSRDDTELSSVALVAGRYDLLALQEILDVDAVSRLAAAMSQFYGTQFDSVVSSSVGHNKKERYAFVWRRDAFSLADSWLYPDNGDVFEREPFCADFESASGPPNSVALCTIHVVFGDSLAPRRVEIARLADVYADAVDRLGSGANVFICGDFNMPPQDDSWQALRDAGLSETLRNPERTTIGDVSLYDNIWVPDAAAALVDADGERAYVYDFDNFVFDNRGIANRVASDHRPISVRLKSGGAGGSLAREAGPPDDVRGFDAALGGGVRLGAWSLDGRASAAPDDSLHVGLVASVAQHYDVLALAAAGDGTPFDDDAIGRVATALRDHFEAGSYVAEAPFVYNSAAVARVGAPFTVSAGSASMPCMALSTGTVDFTLCAAALDGAGAAADLYAAAAAASDARGHVIMGGSFGGDVSASQFDALRALPSAPRAAISDAIAPTTLMPSAAAADGSVQDTLWVPKALVDASSVSGALRFDLDTWWLAPGQASRARLASLLSLHAPTRVLVDNGGGFDAAPDCRLIISEYVEGESRDKALELYNPTDAPIALEFYALLKISNGGSDWLGATSVSLGADVVAPGAAYVLANSRASQPILERADFESGSFDWTGNDALALQCDGAIVDVIGRDDERVDDGWPVAGVAKATENGALVRRAHVVEGVGADWALSAGSTRYDSQWRVASADGSALLASTLGSHDASASSAVGARTDALFISEYVESSSNKAVELFNPSAAPVDLSFYRLAIGTGRTVSLADVGMLDAGDVLWVVNSAASSALRDGAALASGALNFNGDDVVELRLDDGALVDAVGDDSERLSSAGWRVAEVDDATADHTLVRRPSVAAGNRGAWSLSAAPDNAAESEWSVLDADEVDLGRHDHDSGLCFLFPGRRRRTIVAAHHRRGAVAFNPQQTKYCCGNDDACPSNAFCDTDVFKCVCNEGSSPDNDCAVAANDDDDSSSSSSSSSIAKLGQIALFIVIVISIVGSI
jgi:endonuclease/exonuclease/phosphatase family metal-dependent hydrolase